MRERREGRKKRKKRKAKTNLVRKVLFVYKSIKYVQDGTVCNRKTGGDFEAN